MTDGSIDDEVIPAGVKRGWYVDPLDESKTRYWDGEWHDPAVPAVDGQDYPRLPPPRPSAATLLRRRVGVGLGALALAALVAIALWRWTDDDAPARPRREGTPSKLVYVFVSPAGCCSDGGSAHTSSFKVSGRWRVEWNLTATGAMCTVNGRISDPGSHGDAGLPPFSGGFRGLEDYDGSGERSITLEFDCPPDSVATAQVRVYD